MVFEHVGALHVVVVLEANVESGGATAQVGFHEGTGGEQQVCSERKEWQSEVLKLHCFCVGYKDWGK